VRAGYSWGAVFFSVLLAGCFSCLAGQLDDDADSSRIPFLPRAKSFSGLIDVRSNPEGAEVTTSLGGACRTPCSLEITAEGPFTLTFTHDGYASTTMQVRVRADGMGGRVFSPNPVLAELAPNPEPPQEAAKKPGGAAQSPPAPSKKRVEAAPPQPPKPPAKKPVTPAQRPSAAPDKPAPVAQPVPAPVAQPVRAPVAQPSPAIWPEPVAAAGGITRGNAAVPADASTKTYGASAAPDKPAPVPAPAAQPLPSIWPEPVAAVGVITKGDAVVPADAATKTLR
jgi:PEGA domain